MEKLFFIQLLIFLFLLFVPLWPFFLNNILILYVKKKQTKKKTFILITRIIMMLVVMAFFPGGSALFSQADVYGPEMCADLSGARTVKSHTDTRRILGSHRSSEAEAASAARRDSRRRADGRGEEKRGKERGRERRQAAAVRLSVSDSTARPLPI